MRPRSPTLATLTTTICLILPTLLLQLAFALADDHSGSSHIGNETKPDLICRPFGICEPCPDDSLNQQLKEPFCQPFGNRRLMHCTNDTSTTPSPSSQKLHHSRPHTRPSHPPSSLDDNHTTHPGGETPAWESCGRIVRQERADFYEFVACNVLFAVISLFVLFARSRRLRAMQARQLAARIGLMRGSGVARARR